LWTPLPEFSLVVERLCILFLSILFICVPSLTIVAIPTKVIRNIALGASYAIPTTLLVWNADKSAHTKWFWGEFLALLFCIMNNHVVLKFILSDKLLRMAAYVGIAVSITIALLRFLCRKTAPLDRLDKRRTVLLLVTISSQSTLYGSVELIWEYLLVNTPLRNQGTTVILVASLLCAGFVVGMLHMDRKQFIEHSVPYAVAHSWALNASVLGASYIVIIVVIGAAFMKSIT
jgi:hypothetical protein